MSRVKLNLFSIFLIFALSIACASALEERFEIYSAVNDIAACSHSVTTNSIVIQNTGDIESYYSVSGIGADFALYSEASFSLMPGESKTLYIFLSPGAIKGSYDLETTVKTSFGLEKTIKQTILVKNCENIHISALNPVIDVNPCQISGFKFNIQNTGDYPEIYNFGFKGLNEYSILSTESLFLSPGEKAQVELFVNPDCSMYGQERITFQAYATTSKYLAETDVYLNIARDYDYSVAIPDEMVICNLKQTEIPVEIKNNVPILNQYEIDVDGPSWLDEDAEIVELAPYDSGMTALIARPSNPGLYSAEITLKSLRGSIVKKGLLNIAVEKCFAVKLNIEVPSDIVVAGHTKQYPVTVINEGTNHDEYEFELIGPEWVSLDNGKVSLNGGEEKVINIIISPADNATGVHEAEVRIVSAETGVLKKDNIVFNVISAEEAYDLKISQRGKRILYGDDAVVIGLENKGILPGIYNLQFEGPNWAKLDTYTVELQPDEKRIVLLETSARESSELGDYEARVIASVKDENLAFVSSFVIKLRDTTAKEAAYLFIQRYIIFVAAGIVVLIIVLIVALFGKRIAARYRNWKLRRQEAARVKAELKQKKKEEKRAKRLLKKALKAGKPSKFWKRLLGVVMVIVAAGVLIGAGVTIAGYAPIVSEIFKQKKDYEFEPIIKIDTEGLEAYGNTVIIRGSETVIPVVVSNNYNDDLVFDIKVEKPWIRTTVKQVELEAGEKEQFNLIVTPDEAEDGLYKVAVSATLEREDKILTENITLNVKKRNLLREALSYIWYFAGGIVVLAAGLYISRKKKKKPSKKEEKQEKSVFEKLKYSQLKKINIDLPKKK